jgi:hypothetical protein
MPWGKWSTMRPKRQHSRCIQFFIDAFRPPQILVLEFLHRPLGLRGTRTGLRVCVTGVGYLQVNEYGWWVWGQCERVVLVVADDSTSVSFRGLRQGVKASCAVPHLLACAPCSPASFRDFHKRMPVAPRSFHTILLPWKKHSAGVPRKTALGRCVERGAAFGGLCFPKMIKPSFPSLSHRSDLFYSHIHKQGDV